MLVRKTDGDAVFAMKVRGGDNGMPFLAFVVVFSRCSPRGGFSFCRVCLDSLNLPKYHLDGCVVGVGVGVGGCDVGQSPPGVEKGQHHQTQPGGTHQDGTQRARVHSPPVHCLAALGLPVQYQIVFCTRLWCGRGTGMAHVNNDRRTKSYPPPPPPPTHTHTHTHTRFSLG